MQYKGLMIVLSVAIALLGSGCSTSRMAVKSDSSFKVQDSRDSVRVEKVMVAVHDTIMETTTITVDRNDTGDTLRLTTVTDRERVRNRDAIAVEKTMTEVVRDTVFVAVRDSVNVSQKPQNAQKSGVVLTLKWVFWIIVALVVLIIVIWVALRLKI